MNILLVYPKNPVTFHSYTHALKFIFKKAESPPLGLLTVAAMLPKKWEKKLTDLNVSPLNEEDILWADFVFLSGMSVQIQSFQDVIKRCNQMGTKVVAGGPLATTSYRQFQGVEHFILNEAEITLPRFIEDLSNDTPKKIYSTDEFPDISKTPVPLWDLLDFKSYATVNIQYSRGCPFDCEFCSITMLNGRHPRTKAKDQFITELDSLYDAGWRGGVFIVDDNFIGNKRKLKDELLPAVIEWSKKKDYPFNFTVEASINIAEDDLLVTLMVEAGIQSVFIGIETPNLESLHECGKIQNTRQDMVSAIKKLQRSGLVVCGGFIIGFDNDTPSIFEQQYRFIQKSGIISAMVGLLNAPVGTKLFQRLKSEQRLIQQVSGNNMDGSINFIPKMSYMNLIRGYKKVLEKIYSQESFYKRLILFLREYTNPIRKKVTLTFSHIFAFLKMIWKLGIAEKGKKYFWKLFFISLFKYPKKFFISMQFAVYGYHFRKVVETI